MRFDLSIALQKPVKPAALLALMTGLAVGCGSEPESQGGANNTISSKASASDGETAAATPAEARKSMFTAGKGARDPFFPGARKTVEPVVAAAPVKEATAEDLKRVLTAGFQGIIGTADRKMALIHNTVLEPRKEAQIVAREGGQEYRMGVRCLDIARDSVTLQVNGQPFPITVSGRVNSPM